MNILHVLACLPVTDLDAAEEWYTRLIGRPPDLRPAEHEVLWNLSETGQIYVARYPDRAGHGHTTWVIDDLEETIAELAGRGVACGEVVDVGPAVKVTVFDPDGNTIQLGQAKERG